MNRDNSFEVVILTKLELILDQLRFMNNENSRKEREGETKLKSIGTMIGSEVGKALRDSLEPLLDDGK